MIGLGFGTCLLIGCIGPLGAFFFAVVFEAKKTAVPPLPTLAFTTPNLPIFRVGRSGAGSERRIQMCLSPTLASLVEHIFCTSGGFRSRDLSFWLSAPQVRTMGAGWTDPVKGCWSPMKTSRDGLFSTRWAREVKRFMKGLPALAL